MRRTASIALAGAVHAAIAMASISYAFAASMERFDTPELPIGQSERVVSSVASVLLLPGRLFWGRWASTRLPEAIEWFVFLGNSVLWGWAIVTLVGRYTSFRRGSRVTAMAPTTARPTRRPKPGA